MVLNFGSNRTLAELNLGSSSKFRRCLEPNPKSSSGFSWRKIFKNRLERVRTRFEPVKIRSCVADKLLVYSHSKFRITTDHNGPRGQEFVGILGRSLRLPQRYVPPMQQMYIAASHKISHLHFSLNRMLLNRKVTTSGIEPETSCIHGQVL